jgi:hypothetical protein
MTFVALIPSNEGVHVTLSNPGVSRVVTGEPWANSRVVLRQPEAVSVTLPIEGTGLFEVQLSDEMLLPFEGGGVETAWTLELPKGSNRFDFDSLIDILLTFRYTALDDWSYRQVVLKRLGADPPKSGNVRVEEQRFISARTDFPDEWYHFNNPKFIVDPTGYGDGRGQVRPPYTLSFNLIESDFSPNAMARHIRRITLAAGGPVPGLVPLELRFEPEAGGNALTAAGELIDGRWSLELSAFTPAATQPTSPMGTWVVRVPNEEKLATQYPHLFTSAPVSGQRPLDLSWLTDVLLVVQYEATTTYPV